MLRPTLCCCLLTLAACGTTPPRSVDTSAPAYRADLAACEASVPSAVNKRNAKTGLAWFTSPFTRWSQIGDGLDGCMAENGWGRTRACTPEELRLGNKAPTVTVTAAGVRCADPPRASTRSS